MRWRLLAVAGAMLAAFAAGRAIPRASSAGAPDAAPVSPQPAPTSAREAPLTPAPRARPPDRPAHTRAVVDDRTYDRRWLDALRAAPDAAAAVQAAVVDALEARRRPHNAALRACFDAEQVEGDITLRLTVPVSSTAEHLHIASPSFVEIAEGTPISASATACIEALLAGDDAIPAAHDATFLARYDGPVEYGLRFWFPAADR